MQTIRLHKWNPRIPAYLFAETGYGGLYRITGVSPYYDVRTHHWNSPATWQRTWACTADSTVYMTDDPAALESELCAALKQRRSASAALVHA